ncbi:histidine kinase [Bifidobacterium sp. UTCIF-37]|nr:histidine kinase [Bifidobacterium sp. UTCIF-37]TPF91564.1 histidine kinase [Bifidobacterium sp. UTCIF-38]
MSPPWKQSSSDRRQTLSATMQDRLVLWLRQLRGERLLRFMTTLLCTAGTLGVLIRDYANERMAIGEEYSLVRFLNEGAGIWYFLVLLVMGIMNVVLRSRNPIALLALEFIELSMGVLFGVGLHSYTQVVLILVLYLCIRLPLYAQAMCDLAMICMITMQYIYPHYLQPWYLALLYIVALAGIASSLLSIVRDRRTADRLLSEARRKTAVLAEERNRAERRLRVTNELHDSVGHGLTSIIALSQGGEDCMRNGGYSDAQLADVFAEITTIARDSLGNTRRILKVFNEEESRPSEEQIGPEPVNQDDVLRLRDWDDIRPVLEHIRSTGITVVFTETGRRVEDPRRSDLCFAVTREALTNALRHGTGLTRIAVAWDHDGNGGTAITVRNDGHVTGNDSYRVDSARSGGQAGGTGLQRLSQRVAKAGGTLSYGPYGDGWVVRAMIP